MTFGPPFAAMLGLGVAAGLVLQRSHFCTMGCVSDAVLFGSFRRARIWALALAVAIIGSQGLDMLGAVSLAASVYRGEGWLFAGAVPGGLMFGFGMVLAGGCVSRNLVRLGSGSVKALAALLVVLVTAVGTFDLLPDTGPAAGRDPRLLPLLALVAAAGLLVFCLRHRAFRTSAVDVATGIALGSLIPLGWLATSLGGVRPNSLNYLALDRPQLVVPVAAGTVLGACAMAWWRREFRIERFSALDDLRRHLLGGALMGVGGVLAWGCTVGQGLTGAATFSPGSLLALSAMLAGGWWGVKYLETGHLLPFAHRRRSLEVAGGGGPAGRRATGP